MPCTRLQTPPSSPFSSFQVIGDTMSASSAHSPYPTPPGKHPPHPRPLVALRMYPLMLLFYMAVRLVYRRRVLDDVEIERKQIRG